MTIYYIYKGDKQRVAQVIRFNLQNRVLNLIIFEGVQKLQLILQRSWETDDSGFSRVNFFRKSLFWNIYDLEIWEENWENLFENCEKFLWKTQQRARNKR